MHTKFYISNQPHTPYWCGPFFKLRSNWSLQSEDLLGLIKVNFLQ